MLAAFHNTLIQKIKTNNSGFLQKSEGAEYQGRLFIELTNLQIWLIMQTLITKSGT